MHHLYLSGECLSVNLRMDTKKHVLKRFLPMSSKFIDFFDATVNVKRGNLHGYIIPWRICTLTRDKISIQTPKFMKKVATGTICIC